MFRKAMVYLGLGDDAEYDAYDTDYDTYDDAEPDQRPAQQRPTHVPQARPVQTSNVSTMPATPSAYPDEPSAIGAVRPMGRSADPQSGAGQTINPSGMGGARPRPQVVRPIAVHNAKPHLVAPVSFNEAQDVADKFKGSQPVIMNLQGADKDLARRLIDFASGLCYGLGGQMERVANQVYLLTPSNVEVSAEERRRMQDRGYDS